MTADDWKRKSVLKSWAISRTRRWKGNFLIKSSVDFWYRRISRRATVPGRNLWGFFTPPATCRYRQKPVDAKLVQITHTAGCLRAPADLAASCFLGALPPVDLRAVCLVRAIDDSSGWWLVVWRDDFGWRNEERSTKTPELYIKDACGSWPSHVTLSGYKQPSTIRSRGVAVGSI